MFYYFSSKLPSPSVNSNLSIAYNNIYAIGVEQNCMNSRNYYLIAAEIGIIFGFFKLFKKF